jgi:exosortase A-associated hydrolase 2
MTNITAEFFQGAQGKLFRLIRTPKHVQGHLLYLSPLFEQANQTRHMLTRSALNIYQQAFESIIFDHYGTGDSEGELDKASLTLWQQDIVIQLTEIRKRSTQPIILSVSLSAALLLSDEILALTDGMILVQAEFNGKRFVQQFKRLALAAELNKPVNAESSLNNDEVAIAGYVMKTQLLEQLSKQGIAGLSLINQPCCWFEWQAAHSELSIARTKLYQMFLAALASEKGQCHFYAIDEVKYWQSTELEVATQYLVSEQHGLAALCSEIAGVKGC